jgi:cellulose synthase/poly-beta-1,6-N-acetylglucosamine synthase-like glycosyltransferase
MMEFILWLLVGLVVYAYVGYPLLLAVVAKLRTRQIRHSSIEPAVSVIIAAFNEEKDIAQKLETVLALDYPKDKLQIVVASDCSEDRTHEIVRGFASRGVELEILPKRAGKTAAQNLAVSKAHGEILLFTDATTELASDVVRKLVAPFADPHVGCAGAQLEYQSKGGTAVGKGGGLYWRYEKRIKELESQANSLIGVSGCLYAVRRAIYKPIPPELISDFVIAFDVFMSGHVTTYVPGAIAREVTHEDANREFAMRRRVVVRSINALVRRASVLNPFRSGLFAVQLWSHKVLRYLVPQLLIGVFLLSLWKSADGGPRAGFYTLMAAAQIFVYGIVPTTYMLFRRLRIRTGMLSAPFYFVHANAAAFSGLLSYLKGGREVTWRTVR